MFKTIVSALYSRVVVAYKSTLIGLAFVAADVVVSSLQSAALPSWVHGLVGVAASLLALYKPAVPPAA